MSEKALLVDVSTTKNNVLDIGNECPIQFSAFEFDFDIENKSLKDIFLSPTRNVTFNIMPDEANMPEAYLKVGEHWPNNFETVQLKEGLEAIHDILQTAISEGFYIIGYCLDYDLSIINKNILRVLGELFVLDFPEDHLVDLRELATRNISVNRCGAYKAETIFVTLYSPKLYFSLVEKYKNKFGSFLDNKISSMILYGIASMCKFESFSEIVNHLQQPKILDTIPFGKYKGVPIKTVLENDIQYLGWLSRQEEIKTKYKDLIYTLEKLAPQLFSTQKPDMSDVSLTD